MANLKTGLKVSLISALLLAGSVTTTAWADHDSHSILPYVAIGVFATILHHNSHGHHYTTKRRYRYSTGHGHGGHYGHSGHRKQHSHSHGGYHNKHKKH